MRLSLNGLRRRSRWLVIAAVTLTLSLVAASLAPAARAGGPDGTLCHMNTSRVRIPSNFTVDACFDGDVLTLRNRTDVALRAYATGDFTRAFRDSDAPSIAAALTTISTDIYVIPPGSYLELWAGPGTADVEMELALDANRRYDITALLLGYLPTKIGSVFGVWDDTASAVEDILSAYAARQRCAAGASWLGGIECSTAMVNSVVHTIDLLAVKLGLDVAKLGLLTGALVNTAWYLFSDSQTQQGDLNAIADSTPTMHIAAASSGTTPSGGNPGTSKTSGGGGGSRPATGPVSVTAANSNGQLLTRLTNFPTGLTYYFCHSGDGSGYPTGGTIASKGSVDITSPNENLGALCSGSGNFWIGFQGTDGHDYYSNEVTLGSTGATATASGSQLDVQLANFPTGLTYYFCHSGASSGYPTGGVIASHSSVTITSPNENLGALCSGSGNFWIGFQGTDGHDYYSNQVTLGSTAAIGATATASGSQLDVQLANFPTGLTYYFCHSGASSGYPTGGAIASHSSVTITSPNENLGALCSGSGNFWIGFQGTDGHDYYSNQVNLG